MDGKGDVEEGGRTFEGTRRTELVRKEQGTRNKELRESCWDWGIITSEEFDIDTDTHTRYYTTTLRQ